LAAEQEEVPANIAAAITEISEHATLLIRDEIELAKAEIGAKVRKILIGAGVGVAAGVSSCSPSSSSRGLAWLFAYELFPSGEIFWGYFMVAAMLLVLAGRAGWLAYRALRGAAACATMRSKRRARSATRCAPRRAGPPDVRSLVPMRFAPSIEANRTGLALSVAKLRSGVTEITDWRKQIDDTRRPACLRGDRGLPARGGFAFGRPRRKALTRAARRDDPSRALALSRASSRVSSGAGCRFRLWRRAAAWAAVQSMPWAGRRQGFSVMR